MSDSPAQKQFWLFPGLWWLINVAFIFWLATEAGFSNSEALTDSLVSNLLLAAFCTGAVFSVRFYRPKPEQSLMLLVGILALTLIWNWISFQLLSEFGNEITGFNTYLISTRYIRLIIGLLMISLFVLLGWISYYISEQSDEKIRNEEIVKRSKDAELNNLRQQLQPHFLFNTLNSISSLAGSNPEMAKKMIHQLADFLRGTIKQSDEQTISLLAEMEHLSLYLAIEKVRFGNRLITNIKIDKDVETLSLPSLLLQPLVENAIKFGLYDTLDEVIIEINAVRDNQYLQIKVTNPFDEATSRKVPGTGFGLSSVHRRLYLLFGRNDLLETKAEKNTFIATLKIPVTG